MDKNYNLMIKVGLPKKSKEDFGIKSCKPHNSISSLFGILVAQDSLEAHKDSAAGEELKILKTRIARLEKRKKDIKHRAIDQLYSSMANLIFFFEMTQTFHYKELDKDIQHLLGIGQFLYDLAPANNAALIDTISIQFLNYLKELGLKSSLERSANGPGLVDTEESRSGIQLDPKIRITLQRFQTNFARLLAGMLDINGHIYPDFRLTLAAIMQDLVTYKVLRVLPNSYGNKEHILMAARNALDGARNWSEDLSESSVFALETTASKRKIQRYSSLTEGVFPDASQYLNDE